MKPRLLTAAVLATTVFSLTAAAQEHEVSLSPFAGNVGNAVWTLVIFVIVVILLGIKPVR